ncbi:RNA-binding protein, partial [Spirochaetota bacterium]
SHDLSADHIIKGLIKKDPNPKMTTVVTSDNGIIFFVKPFRSKLIKSEDFALLLQKTIEDSKVTIKPEKEENPELSDEEISYWEKIFSRKKNS